MTVNICPECNGSLRDSYQTGFGRLCRDCYERLTARDLREQLRRKDMKLNGEWMGTLNTELYSCRENKGRKRKS